MPWDSQNKETPGWTGKSSFVLEVPLRYLRPSIIYSVPCDRIVQRTYWAIWAPTCFEQQQNSNYTNLGLANRIFSNCALKCVAVSRY